ncbi:hypothetical protein BC939DRAFT_109493 [Gamsiella multidivaricata]|uniref:uncharacterized protein n=1 Tax=Gamsiella multidivaricata TaxID=101098 RepID=UPI00222033B1|nr:uncharacterized protein BC939DRAFT_109493 [Gamsiella multidivaricata]KAI7826968.1 hypothetical protein BC939DRAFT_109493 [Gamsiella multidivaricata]
MISIHRTILLLDHSPQARRKACYDNTKKDEAADEDSDDEFEPEPCSMWSSFVHAALQYSRLAWDLSPVGQKSQISVHVAPGGPAIYNSIILNAWTVQEQSLGHISYHLQELQHQEDAAAMNEQEIAATSKGWILLALQGAIAHILEPISQQPGSAPSAQTTPHHSSITANVIMVLTDMEDQPEDLPEDQPREGEEDTVMDNDMTVASEHDKGWRYGDLDIRKILVEALQTLQDALRSTKLCADMYPEDSKVY